MRLVNHNVAFSNSKVREKVSDFFHIGCKWKTADLDTCEAILLIDVV